MNTCQNLATDIAAAMQDYADSVAMSSLIIISLGLIAGIAMGALIWRRGE